MLPRQPAHVVPLPLLLLVALLHLLLLLQLVRQLPMEPLVRLCRLLTEVQQLLLQLVVLPQRLPAALLLPLPLAAPLP